MSSMQAFSDSSDALRADARPRSPFAGVTWNVALVASIAAIAAAGVVALRDLPALVAAIVAPAPDPDRPDGVAELVAQHPEASELAKRRFDQRTFFFAPLPPPPPPKPPEPPRREEPPPPPLPPPPPPGPPATYGGPKPYSMLGDLVYFPEGRTIRAGEERDGIRVLSVKAPWSVRLGWQGGEYDVDILFARSESFFGNLYAAESGATPGLLAPEMAASALEGIKASGAAPPPPVATPVAPRGRAAAAPPPEAEGREQTDEQTAPANGEEGAVATPSVPERLTREQVDQMDRAAAIRALSEVSRARGQPDLDEETRQRLNEDYEMLIERMRALGSGGAPPPSK